MSKVRLATIWLDGCSGCHMSFLDMDEAIIALVDRVDLVYSPLVDAKTFPDAVDVVLVEGSVSTDEDLEKVRRVRRHSKLLVALGDCACTGNVPAMRNPFGPEAVLHRAFIENAARQPQIPDQNLPRLLPLVRPVHDAVEVDLHVPGCPPPARAIHYVLMELLEGRTPQPLQLTRFGK